jgi:diguanylate cyclase (GGDEF)-like protein
MAATDGCCAGLRARETANLPDGQVVDGYHGSVGDPLTGLPNRLLFLDRLERAIERFQRCEQALFAVMFLDLDNFKLINDSLGHQAGDRLLITIAERLETCLRASDSVCRLENGATVARHAGDEFTILLEDLKSPDDVTPIADRILRAISRPVQLDSQEIVPTLSIGWAVTDAEVASAEDILREADTAMYQAKLDGRNCSRRFESGMHNRAKLRLSKDLRHGR